MHEQWKFPSVNYMVLGFFVGLIALYVPVERSAPVVSNLAYGTRVAPLLPWGMQAGAGAG